MAVPTPSTEEHATVPARAIPDGAKAGGSGPDDEFLVALAKNGQNDAYDQLVRRYRRFVRVKSSSYFLLGGDADDLMQEGMLGLFKAIRNMCVEPGKMCMSEMMAIDARGGLGLEGLKNVLALQYDKNARRGTPPDGVRTYVAGICTPDDTDGSASATPLRPRSATPILGLGLPRPDATPFRFDSSARTSRAASNS